MTIEYIEFDDPAPLLSLDAGDQTKQGTEEWKQARVGMITASRISDMLAQGNGETRKKYLYDLAMERLTGKPRPQRFKSKRMEQGNILEPEGRALYEFYYDDVREVGFINHPTIPNFGASPDGLVGAKGGLELKNRDLQIHLDLCFTKKPPRSAMLQMYAQMSCCGLDWVDYGSYNMDELPSHLQLVVVRIERNQAEIEVIEREVIKFDNEIELMVKKLRNFK